MCQRGQGEGGVWWTDLWEVAGAVADQQTCLAAPAVADDDELLRVRGRLGDGCVACVGCVVGADGAVAVAFAGGPDGLAHGCDGRRGSLCALLAAQVVVVLGRRGLRGHCVGVGGCVDVWVCESVCRGEWVCGVWACVSVYQYTAEQVVAAYEARVDCYHRWRREGQRRSLARGAPMLVRRPAVGAARTAPCLAGDTQPTTAQSLAALDDTLTNTGLDMSPPRP